MLDRTRCWTEQQHDTWHPRLLHRPSCSQPELAPSMAGCRKSSSPVHIAIECREARVNRMQSVSEAHAGVGCEQEKGHKALGQQAAISHVAQMAAFMGLGVWWLLEPCHHGPAQVWTDQEQQCPILQQDLTCSQLNSYSCTKLAIRACTSTQLVCCITLHPSFLLPPFLESSIPVAVLFIRWLLEHCCLSRMLHS